MSDKHIEAGEGISLHDNQRASEHFIEGNGGTTANSPRNTLQRANSMYVSPEMFEKMFLSPQNKVHGNLRKTFANPTPVGLIGFVISLTPLCMNFMGWHGATGGGAAVVGSYYLIGGVCMFLAGILEWVLGNTFPFVVFVSFGGFYSTYGTILTPSFNAAAAYSPTGNALEGAKTPGYNNSIAFYLLWWSVLIFIYLICSIRTNVVFVIVFFTLDMCAILLSATYFKLAEGNEGLAMSLEKASGAFGFVSTLAGWYILLAQMLAALDFPFEIPVGDLSMLIASGTQKAKMRVAARKEGGENV